MARVCNVSHELSWEDGRISDASKISRAELRERATIIIDRAAQTKARRCLLTERLEQAKHRNNITLNQKIMLKVPPTCSTNNPNKHTIELSVV